MKGEPDVNEVLKQGEICNDNKAACFCLLAKDHSGDHVCRCGGSWNLEWKVISFPNIDQGYNAYPLSEAEKLLLNSKGLEQ